MYGLQQVGSGGGKQGFEGLKIVTDHGILT